MLNSGNVYKYLDAVSGGFWNCKKLLSYGKPWNFVTGSRSVGKSTNIACFFILDFLENGHKFIYCRRTKDETLLTCQTFFGNAISIINSKTDFNIKSLEYNGGEYYILLDGEEEKRHCGSVVPLSLEQKYKSANFSEYCNLVFDEFICQDSTRYLGSKTTPDREYRAVLSLYQTIDRGIDRPFRNETRFFFLGNTATIYNPIFLSIGISDYIEDTSKFISPKSKLWVLERIESVDAMTEIEQSFSYQLSDEEGINYAFKNKGNDTDAYIKRPPEHNRAYICTLIKDGRKYGVWADGNRIEYFIDVFHDIGAPEISLDVESHHGNDLMLVTTWADYPIIRLLLDRFKVSHLYFGNGRIKNVFYKYFKLLPQ